MNWVIRGNYWLKWVIRGNNRLKGVIKVCNWVIIRVIIG